MKPRERARSEGRPGPGQHDVLTFAASDAYERVAVSASSRNSSPATPVGRDDQRRALEISPTKATLPPAEVDDLIRRQERVVGARTITSPRSTGRRSRRTACRPGSRRPVTVVGAGRDIGRCRCWDRRRQRAVDVLHQQQPGLALVELVVSDADHVEADIFVKSIVGSSCISPDSERASPDQVPGADDIRVRLLGAEGLQVRGGVLGPARGHQAPVNEFLIVPACLAPGARGSR